MEFKKLELEPESNWLKRLFSSKHTQKSILYALIGAIVGFLYFYFTEGKNMDTIETSDFISSILMGAFFGLFITNSPCARNKC